MSVSLRRLAGRGAVGLLVLLVIALVLAHTAMVRDPLWSWAQRTLLARYHLQLTAERFRYNALTRHVSLTGVRLAAEGHEAQPFFTADRIDVSLPWAVFRRRLAFSEIAIDGGTVLIARDGAGVSNLPVTSGGPPPERPRRLDVRALRIRGLDFQYLDARNDVDVRVGGIEADWAFREIRVFSGAAGRLAFTRGIQVRYGDTRTASGPVEGAGAFDGSTVNLQQLALAFPDADLVLDGRIVRVLDAASMELDLTGTAHLAEAVKWAPPPMPIVGDAAIEGRLTGPFTEFVHDARARAEAVTIGRATGIALEATTRLTLDDLDVQPFTLTKDGASVTGRYQMTFGDEGRLALDASWRQLDLDLGLAIADLDTLPIATTTSGTVRLTRGPGDDAAVDMRATATNAPLATRGRVPLGGTATWTYRGGRWAASYEQRAFGDVRISGAQSGVARDGDLSRASLNGPLTIAAPDVGATLRAARAAGVAAPAIAGIEGPLTIEVQTGGTLTSPTAAGTLRSDGLRLAGADAVVTAALEASTAAARLTGLTLQGAGTTVTGEAAIALPSRRLSGTLDARVDDLARLLAIVDGAPDVGGAGTARVTLGGTAGDPDIGADLRFTGLGYRQQRADRLDALARIDGTTVVVERMALAQGEGRLEGTARYDWRLGAYAASVRGDGLRVVRPFGDGPDRARAVVVSGLRFDGQGTRDRPGGTGDAAFAFDGGRAGGVIGSGTAALTFVSGVAQVNVFVPTLRTVVTAQVQPRAPYAYQGVLVAHELNIGPVVALSGLAPEALEGIVSLSASFEGSARAPEDTDVLVNLQQAELSAGGVPVRLTAPVRLQWRDAVLVADDVVAQIGGGELRASGRVVSREQGTWQARFRGPVADLVTIAQGFGVAADVAAAGEVAADWRTTGGLSASTASLQWTGGRLQWSTLPAVEALQVEAGFDGRVVDVTALTGRWQDGGIEATARLPLALFTGEPPPAGGAREGRARVRVTGLTTAALAPWVSADRLARMSGRVSGTLEADVVESSLAGVRGIVELDEARLVLNGVPFEQGRPTRFTLADGQLAFDDVQWIAGGSPLILSGSVGVANGGASPVDVRIEGAADLRAVAAAVPGVASDGTAVVDVRVTGTASAPSLDGTIALDDAEVVMDDPRIVLSDLTGPIRLDGMSVNIPQLEGFVNGGRATIVGVLQLGSGGIAGGELLAQIQGAVFEVPEGLQSEVDALLRYLPHPETPRLSGDVLVQRSAYRANISIPALLRRNRTTGRTVGGRTFADRLRLDIAVESVEDLEVDNNYGRMQAGLDLRILGTASRPGVTGRAALREGGQVYLLGNTYRLQPSGITFTDPAKIAPDLNISTLTQLQGRTVTLTITGPLDRLETNVQSSDASETTQSLASVLVGKDIGGEDALAMLSSEILGTTGRALGLDTLRVERGFSEDDIRQDPGLIAQETDPSSRLTLSKRLRANVEIILSQNLRESGGLSVVFAYRPLPRLELRAVSRDNGNRSYAVRHEITFGGGATNTLARALQDAPRVSQVSFSGVEPGDEAALEAQLAVRAGKRFDFSKWRDDVDRLRRWYHQRGHFEARVRADRASNEAAGTTSLVYRVTPGPRTTLVIEGLEPDADLRASLEEAWTDSVFEQFLLRDMETRVQRALIARDVVGGLVEATVTERSDAAKTIRVAVSPGTQVAGRILEFEGRSAIAERRLRQEIEAAGLTLDAWLAPARLEEPLELLYASQGYFNAKVTARPPELAGDRAVLRITVDEGLRYTLASVRYDGVDDPQAELVARATQLRLGEPYVLEDVELARERIEEVYHSAGFGAADVEVRPFIDPAAYAATLTFVVTPGPQQVLRGIEVTGASHTSTGVVENALRLETGAPVDLRAWAQARKRLYDTNVFRQVDVRAVPMDVPDGHGQQPVRAVVEVAEWPVWTFRYGLQVNDDRPGEDPSQSRQGTGALGTDIEPAVIGDLQNRNLFGRAVSAGLYTRLERERRTTSTFVSFPTLFGSRLRTNLFGFTSEEDIDAPFLDSGELRLGRTGFTLEQRIRRARAWEIVYGYRIEKERLFDQQPDPLDPFPYDVRFLYGRFTGSAFLDRRIDVFDPKGGWFSAVTLERISEFESRSDFAKLLATHFRYVNAGPLLLAGAVRVGTSFLGETLYTERFFVGGATTVRGYAEDSLGPLTPAGAARGGDSLLVLNGEVRLPLYGWLKGVGFIDAGNVFEERNPFRFGELAVGYGGGLRLDSPIGLLRVDVGFPADRRAGDRRARWYFGIGQVF